MSAELKEKTEQLLQEQQNLDQLRQKSRDLQAQLEQEAALMTPTPKPKPQPAGAPNDPKTTASAKERLKEKLLLKTAQKTGEVSVVGGGEATPASPKFAPVPPAPADSNQSLALAPTTNMRFTSSTHPTAWHFLYRLTKNEDKCPKEVYDQWHAGGLS